LTLYICWLGSIRIATLRYTGDMNDSEQGQADHGSEVSRVDYAALHAEALELNHQTFADRAARESDPVIASDLRFGDRLASQLRATGALALVVGGYARDAALERITGEHQTSKDIDIEVYGLSFEELVPQLQPMGRVDLVGANFGIAKLTNPETGSILDFSIPRKDSKVDKGHRGFQVTGNPDMSVKEAARRRDLTINALALNPLTGELIDEYGGLQDLKVGVLRATDPELFGDDPLRVLRIMQFAGRFNFVVEPATAEICRSLDLTTLPAARLGEEWSKLMTMSPRPSVGLEVARELGVLEQLHSELSALDQIDQEPDWHPEGNVWEHTKLAADAAAEVVRREHLTGDDKLVVLYGALCHDLGKATTTEEREKKGVTRITAHGHEAAGVAPTESFLKGINMKGDVIEKILPIVREHLYHVHNPEPTDKQLQRFSQRLQPASIRLWDLISRCDANAVGGQFREVTASHNIYERSLGLHVSEKPTAPIVQGRDLIERLDMTPGPAFKAVLDYLYDAQLGGEISTIDAGIEYYRAHEAVLIPLMNEAQAQASRPQSEK
jgi:tRNA nucleotidyltransferase (CCA-adding enzyme)